MPTIPPDLQQSFSSLSLEKRLGNLASTFVHIASAIELQPQRKNGFAFVREAMAYIEWTANDLELDRTVEMVDMQRQLAHWSRIWDQIWTDDLERQKVQIQARAWAEKLLSWMEELQARR